LLKFHLKDKGITPEEALDELEGMYKVYFRDPKNRMIIDRVVTISKKQEIILKAVHKDLLA
jgi:hypothetical protein